MNEVKESMTRGLYDEISYYDEDLYELARILVKILPQKMIMRIIGKLFRIRRDQFNKGVEWRA